MSSISATTLRKAARLVQEIPLPLSEWDGEISLPSLFPKKLLVVTRYDGDVLCRSAARKPDQHHRYVWILCLKGEGGVCVNTRVVSLKPGECFLILPFQTHFYLNLQKQDIQWLFITFEHEKNPKLDRIHANSPLPMTGKAFKYFVEFANARISPIGEAASLHHLALVLEELSQAQAPQKPVDASPHRTPNGMLFTKINQFAINNRARIFTITELARHLGVSESYLRSQFRIVTGRSLGLFIRELRLSHASELLLDPVLRISEISERCGYDSPFVFSRAFRRLFHCTPTEYRETHKKPLDIAEASS